MLHIFGLQAFGFFFFSKKFIVAFVIYLCNLHFTKAFIFLYFRFYEFYKPELMHLKR